MVTAASFTVVKTWKQPQCSSTGEWVGKSWHIHTMEYYSAILKKNTLRTVTWVNLKNIAE